MKTLKETKVRNGENETIVKRGLYQDGQDYLVMTFSGTKKYKNYKNALKYFMKLETPIMTRNIF